MQRVAANTEFPDPSDPGADFITELTLPAGDNQVFISTNDPLFNETISSGQRLRLVIDNIGVNAASWTVQLEASALSLYQQPAGVVPISMGGTGRTTIGTANTVLTVGNYGDKLIYKDLVAGDNINIVSAPIEVGGNEIGGTITISSTLPPGLGNGTVYAGNSGELAYYANTGSTVIGASNLIWNNTNKKLNITSVPASWSTSSISVLIGNTSFNSGSAYGTVFGINLPSTSAFTGNFIDLQINNTNKLSVNYEGNISSNKINVNSAQASTSYTTGALIVSGGVGIAGNLNLNIPLAIGNGGTGVTTISTGQLLIGNTSGGYTTNTLTGSDGVTIISGDGSITIGNTAVKSINGLTSSIQVFNTSTSGSNFDIISSSTSHTFVLPDASSSSRGVVTTGDQTFSGNKTFSTAIISQDYYTNNNGYFGGDPNVFLVQGTTGSIYFGIMKSDAVNRFTGMKVLEKQSPTLGPGYLYGDIVFYTDSEAEDFSTERLRIDGAGLITAANDVTINGELTLTNAPLSVGSGGTGTSAFSNGELLIGNSTTSSLNKNTLTAGNGIEITNGPGSITVSSVQSKSICILSPTNTDDITLFFTDASITLQKTAAIIRGTSASVTYSVYYDQNRTSTSAVTVLSTTASAINNATTTGQITNLSTNNTPVASSSIWLKITSVTNADEFHLTLFYK
jgi:hypothetical protein